MISIQFNSHNLISVITKGISLSSLLLLVACGGSGGGGGSTLFVPQTSNTGGTWKEGVFKASSTYANLCAVPRTGTDPNTKKAYPDKLGTTTDENNFLRSWSNETYLWYSEIPDVNPASYADPLDYFSLLKTSALTTSGNPKDKFHFTYASSDWYSLSVEGKEGGYGMQYAFVTSTPPRNIVVAYTEPSSPAVINNIQRGAKIISVDGYDLVNGGDSATVDKLNAGLFPSAGELHTFEIQDYGSSTTRTVSMQAAEITKTPVQNVKVLDTPSGKVGYFLFTDHIATAEQELVDAINQLRTAAVTDLVLDIRYNGGGYLYIASELAYMIAGDTATSGKTFEKTIFNDKYTDKDFMGNSLTPTPFYNASEGIGNLPSLNLSRVFVITSGDTCSASEAIINGLRGVNVEVIQIGSQTCGKPYGFYPEDNCGTTYFTIQFKGVNDKGFGEYSDGFVPSDTDNGEDLIKGCSLGDDFTHALGDVAEKNLATALQYRTNGSCSLPGSFAGISLPPAEALSNAKASLNKEPGLTNRIMK